MMKNPRFVNEAGGILMDYDDDGLPSLYIDTGELYSRALAGEFGPVAPYEPPAADPGAERLQRIAEIDRRLAEIDQESVRPLRAIVGDADTEHDRAKLAELEREAEQLRAERRELTDDNSR